MNILHVTKSAKDFYKPTKYYALSKSFQIFLAIFLCLILCPFLMNKPFAEEDIFKQLQDRYLVIATTMLRTPPPGLPRYLKEEIEKNIDIDEQDFLEIVKKKLSPGDVTITDELFTAEELDCQDCIPFKIIDGKLFVSTKIKDAPESQFYFYITFIKFYSGLHSSIHQYPGIVTTGICALFAQEFTYRSTLAVLPRFFHETALANLIYCYDPQLIHLPFQENFNLDAFNSRVQLTLSNITGLSISNIDTLLSLNDGFESQLLFSQANEPQLRSISQTIDSRIHNLTIRFILYNALQKHIDTIRRSVNTDQQITASENISGLQFTEKATDMFFTELGSRYGSVPQGRLRDLRFEKNTFGALFQLLYNSSKVIPDSFKSRGLTLLRLDDPELVESSKEKILIVINQESRLNPLLNLLGQPRIVLGKKTDSTKVLGLKWPIERLTTTLRCDLEFVQVEFKGRAIAGRKLERYNKENLGGGNKKNKRLSIQDRTTNEPVSKGEPRPVQPFPLNGNPDGEGNGKGKIDIGEGLNDKGTDVRALNKKMLDMAADLTSINPPKNWEEKLINLSTDDLLDIRSLDIKNRVTFNFIVSAFSGLNKHKREELIRFMRYFIDFNKIYTDKEAFAILKTSLPLLTQEIFKGYIAQREEFLAKPDIRLLRHLIQKFIFLAYTSDVFNYSSNVSALNQDILEISLRTVLSQNGTEYEGYQFFSDLETSLIYLFKFIQDMKYFNHNSGNNHYGDITIDISPALFSFIENRLSALNINIIPDLKIQPDEVIINHRINLRNLITQLEKIKNSSIILYKPGQNEKIFQEPCDCNFTKSNIYDCLILADDHVIDDDEDSTESFNNCFGKYFSLKDIRKQ